jgi:hypothetical protein
LSDGIACASVRSVYQVRAPIDGAEA